jgi:hypothetical protein
MECDRARILMAEVLEGGQAPGLAEHTATCPSCGPAWSRLQAVDALLRAEPLRHPPPNFPSRVMHRLEAHERRRPAWQGTAMELGALVCGTLTVVVGMGLLVHGWDVTMAGSWLAEEAELVGRGALLLAGALWAAAMRDAAVASLDVLLAVAVAMGWFGALVVPRWAVRRVR